MHDSPTQRWRLAAATLVCLLGASAPRLSSQIQPDPEAEATTYSVQGTVVDSVTNQPIARALVAAQQDAALTNNEGSFELHLPAGMAQIRVQRPGYDASEQDAAHGVQIGADMPALTFSLRPDAVIAGQVTFSSSDSADGVNVTAWRRAMQNGRQRWQMQQTATTNSEGMYRIAGLPAGEYLLSTAMEREQDAPIADLAAKAYGYPATWYPGVAEPATASVLTLTAGQHAQADLTLTHQPFYPVMVRLPPANGRNGMDFDVLDSSGQELSVAVRQIAQEGVVRFELPSGNYTLEAHSEGRPGEQALGYGRVDLKVAGAPLAGPSLTLLPLHAIPVIIHKDFTATAAEGGGDHAGTNLSLSSADEFAQPSRGAAFQAVRGDPNSFEIAAVGPGRYWVIAYSGEGYISSITSGGVDLLREPLVVGMGSTSPPIEVTLRNDFGAIEGHLTAPAASTPSGITAPPLGEQRQIIVYAIPLFASSGEATVVGMQPSGEFSFTGLPPGPYRVAAFTTPQKIDFHSAEGLAKYSGSGQTVTVEPGGTANVQLDSVDTGPGGAH
jgi:hypothetical protein